MLTSSQVALCAILFDVPSQIEFTPAPYPDILTDSLRPQPASSGSRNKYSY